MGKDSGMFTKRTPYGGGRGECFFQRASGSLSQASNSGAERSPRAPRRSTRLFQYGGPRAGARLGGSLASPTPARYRATFPGSVTTATRRNRPPHLGQHKISNSALSLVGPRPLRASPVGAPRLALAALRSLALGREAWPKRGWPRPTPPRPPSGPVQGSYLTVCRRGDGTDAASRLNKDKGSPPSGITKRVRSTATVPSENGRCVSWTAGATWARSSRAYS